MDASDREARARARAAGLLSELRSGRLDVGRLRGVHAELRELLPDPNFLDYAVDHVPELTADEVVARAFAYVPIRL